MKPNIHSILTATMLMICLCSSCNRPGEDGEKQQTAAGDQPGKSVAIEPAPQQQAVPDAEQFSVDEDQKDARGLGQELPAGWPGDLPVPEGAEISQAASREGTELVEFTISRPLEDIASLLDGDAQTAGYELLEASRDKYSRGSKYRREDRLYATTVTQVDDKCFARLSISQYFPSQSFSGSTHYSGEFELPAEWPVDILPVYAGSVLRELYVPLPGQAGRLMLSAQNSAEEAAVIGWLEQELPARGWTAGEKTSRNGFSIRKFTGNGYSLSVAARGIDGLTDIQYEASPI
ncbi:MAG: hypothetical protein R3F46_05760 [bacterium]